MKIPPLISAKRTEGQLAAHASAASQRSSRRRRRARRSRCRGTRHATRTGYILNTFARQGRRCAKPLAASSTPRTGGESFLRWLPGRRAAAVGARQGRDERRSAAAKARGRAAPKARQAAVPTAVPAAVSRAASEASGGKVTRQRSSDGERREPELFVKTPLAKPRRE